MAPCSECMQYAVRACARFIPSLCRPGHEANSPDPRPGHEANSPDPELEMTR
jgi:hypothetical protein